MGALSRRLNLSGSLEKILCNFEEFLQLIAVKAHDDLPVNHGDWSGHIAKLLEFGNRRFIGGDVSIRELNLVL